jgi:hypothetical protein
MPRGRVGRRRRGDDRQLRGRRVTVGLVAAISTLLLSAHTAEFAHAGAYVMRNCSVPGYANAPLGPWHAQAVSNNLAVADACANGGGWSFSFVGAHELPPGGASIMLSLDRPTMGPQSAIQLVKVSLWVAARLGGSGEALSLMAVNEQPDGHQPGWQISGPPGSENLGFVHALTPAITRSYKLVLWCGPLDSSPPSGPCVADHETPLQVRGMEVTLSEDLLPTVLSPGGSLLSRGPQQGVRTLSYAASDPQSGLAKVEVLLGDTVVKTHDLASRCFHSDFTVCPASDDGTLEIDTRELPNGSYDLTLRVTDAAGNQQVVYGERAVDIVNDGPAAAATNVLPYAIAANFKGTSRRTLTVPYGKRVSLRGRLTQGSRVATAGSPIEVLERLDRRGAHEKVTRTIKTKADGSFSIGLATSRPSRVIRLAYRPAGGAQVVTRALKLRVIAASRVRATLRGRVVRFSGKVLSGPIPNGGKRVQMEGRSPGSAWTPFKNLRTDKKGRFSGTYRLRVRRPGVVLKVRAIVPSEAGYGYLGSSSRAVTLRVR